MAILEYLAHIDRSMIPDDLALFGVRLPEDAAESIALDSLPKDWNRIPAPNMLAAIGDAWARARSSFALEVPAVVAPGDNNVLINPGHPAFHTMRAPSAFLLTAWNYRVELIAKVRTAVLTEVRFIVPIPHVTVICELDNQSISRQMNLFIASLDPLLK